MPDDNPDLSKLGAQSAAGRRCASCHTDTFAGTKATARVASQREEYLLKALHDYKSGLRSGGGVAAMADVAYPLHEEEITALAHLPWRILVESWRRGIQEDAVLQTALKHDPEKWKPVFHGERIRSPQIMLKQKDKTAMRSYLIASVDLVRPRQVPDVSWRAGSPWMKTSTPSR